MQIFIPWAYIYFLLICEEFFMSESFFDILFIAIYIEISILTKRYNLKQTKHVGLVFYLETFVFVPYGIVGLYPTGSIIIPDAPFKHLNVWQLTLPNLQDCCCQCSVTYFTCGATWDFEESLCELKCYRE